MIQISIVENNKIMAVKIKETVLEVLKVLRIKEDEYQLDLYYNGENALDSGIEYNLVFLDVDLGEGIDGFEVGRQMNATYKIKPLLIVLSNFKDRGEESFDIRAHWYLTKSSIEKKLRCIATGAIKEIIPTNGVFVKENGKEHFVYFKYIRLIYREDSSVYIFTIDSVFITYKSRSLEHWKEILPSDQFLFAHKSNIVGMAYIKEITEDEIIMHCPQKGEKVKIARRRVREVKRTYKAYLLAKARRRL